MNILLSAEANPVQMSLWGFYSAATYGLLLVLSKLCCTMNIIVHTTPTELGFFDMRDLHPFENYFCFYCIFILSFKKMALKISIPGSLN